LGVPDRVREGLVVQFLFVIIFKTSCASQCQNARAVTIIQNLSFASQSLNPISAMFTRHQGIEAKTSLSYSLHPAYNQRRLVTV